MVLIFLDAWYFFGLKEEIIGHHLVDCAGKWKDISIRVIIMTYEYLWRPIFSSLNIFCKMFITKTSVTKIGNFEEKFIVEFYLYIFPC